MVGFLNLWVLLPFLITFFRAIFLFGPAVAAERMLQYLESILPPSTILLWFGFLILIFLLTALLPQLFISSKLLVYMDTLPLAYLLFDEIIIPQSGDTISETKYGGYLNMFGIGKSISFESRIAFIGMFFGYMYWFWYKAKEVPRKMSIVDVIKIYTANGIFLPLMLLFPVLIYALYKTMLLSLIVWPSVCFVLALLISYHFIYYTIAAYNFNVFVSACCKHMTDKWPWEIKT